MSLPSHVPGALEMAHRFISGTLSTDDHAIDATAGNGHDTLFLARIVGSGGRVSSFDIQEQAIRNTAGRVGGIPHVKLFHTGHENISDFVSSPVKAVMFNLGYLPAGDKSIITNPETSRKGLEASLNILSVGGLVTVTAYTGHHGGLIEAGAIGDYLSGLPQTEFKVAKYQIINQKNQPPHLFVIERIASEL